MVLAKEFLWDLSSSIVLELKDFKQAEDTLNAIKQQSEVWSNVPNKARLFIHTPSS